MPRSPGLIRPKAMAQAVVCDWGNVPAGCRGEDVEDKPVERQAENPHENVTASELSDIWEDFDIK
jgi:hypothetical protein